MTRPPGLLREAGGSKAATETDLHALAVLLFQLWVWHHPLHGELELLWANPRPGDGSSDGE